METVYILLLNFSTAPVLGLTCPRDPDSENPPLAKGDLGNNVALIVVVYGMLKNSTLRDKD